ncbi:unnamed protein product [Dracunculus medinensis]|uniref:Uncharacterized protein n=1 Tax=Dracunculus medinensis TaxID=318479 RepID=A0A3P7SF92_DRAME|nr:unnamed protein product [Dracunculus medinensis]
MLPIKKQEEINRFMGNICEQHPSNKMLKLMENGVKIKRKPNFMRFGRSGRPNRITSYFFGPMNLIKGRQIDPIFLRFGKSAEPNFLRFGKRSQERNFFVRYGDELDRESRRPNFLRFGK